MQLLYVATATSGSTRFCARRRPAHRHLRSLLASTSPTARRTASIRSALRDSAPPAAAGSHVPVASVLTSRRAARPKTATNTSAISICSAAFATATCGSSTTTGCGSTPTATAAGRRRCPRAWPISFSLAVALAVAFGGGLERFSLVRKCPLHPRSARSVASLPSRPASLRLTRPALSEWKRTGVRCRPGSARPRRSLNGAGRRRRPR